jgi:hypothetical protein|tara:strand:- start:26583 stop:26774 length:192 start_codon:yes stop_codon:yes gene_type:complete
MTDEIRSELKAIEAHQENKVDSIQSEITVQLLSFAGLTIAFGIGLMRTIQMYRRSKSQIKNLN